MTLELALKIKFENAAIGEQIQIPDVHLFMMSKPKTPIFYIYGRRMFAFCRVKNCEVDQWTIPVFG